MEDLCNAVGGCFLDLLSGQYRINLLEPRRWDDGSEPEDPDAPPAFRGSLLSQHISFLRDIFRVYKGFDTPHIDALELMVEQLYQKWGISDKTDFQHMRPTDYPILSDLYDTIEETYQNYDGEMALYPREMLRDLLLGLHSMCKGADARFFNGHTNISSSRFLVFCVKGLDNVAQNLRDALLFNILSYMSDQLLTAGNTVAAIDELYLWLSNPTAVTYIRNSLKRVRKKESALILASQNLEDFDQPGIRELTRPLFAIPTHQFLFNAGSVDKRFYMDNFTPRLIRKNCSEQREDGSRSTEIKEVMIPHERNCRGRDQSGHSCSDRREHSEEDRLGAGGHPFPHHLGRGPDLLYILLHFSAQRVHRGAVLPRRDHLRQRHPGVPAVYFGDAGKF